LFVGYSQYISCRINHVMDQFMIAFRTALLIGVCTLALGTTVTAQRSVIWQEKPGTWSVNAGLGATRYLGDLEERFNLAHLQLGVAIGGAVTYRKTDQLALRADVQLYYIRGAHEHTYLAFNNLSFRSLNPDVSVGVQYDFWSSKNKNYAVVPYAIAGVGLTYMTPRAKYRGNTYSLAPLRTEGIAYNRLPIIMRYGVGVPVFSTERFKGTIEGVYTHVFSDYLDDVSTRYVDRSGMTPLAAALSDRAPEVGTAPNAPGAKRGNSKRNDGYLTLSARVVFIIITPQQRLYRRMFGG